MTRLISNKHKQAKFSDHDSRPTPFMKNATARKLRRSQLETEVDLAADSNATPGSQDKLAKYKRPGNCPLCLERLKKTSGLTRYERSCQSCGAVLQKDLLCLSCSTNRVWAGQLGRRCKGCGKTFLPEASSIIK